MVHETKMSNGENLHGRFEVENIALKAGPKRGFGLGKKFLAVLGAVMFTSLWAVVDAPDCFSYQIKWGGQYLGEDACGYTDEPGCCIHFTDELDEFFGGGYGYADVIVDSYGIGLPYTIYRDDVAIATGVTEYGLNGSMWFTDYDVVPGRTYKYEIKVRGEDVNRILGTDFCIAADSGRLEYTTGPTNVECYFIHTAEIKPTEVAFDKEGGDLDVGVKIYRNTASETIREDRPGYWLNTDSDWIGVRDASQLDWQREFITISADANETGAAREGIVTVGYQGFEWQIKVRQSSAADIAQDPDPVPPDPVTRTVTFNANGGSVSPATCTVEDGASVGELPAATWDGHTLDGWFTAADGGDAVTAETIITADVTFYAHWTEVVVPPEPEPVTPGYEVIEATDIVAPYEVPKAVTVQGVAYDGDDVVGIVELKLGKVNEKKQTSKVSGAFTGLDGKKITLKTVNVTGIDGTAPASVSLEVKNLGTMNVTIGGTQFAGSLGRYHVQSATVGSNWAKDTATVGVNVDDVSMFAGRVLSGLLPDGEQATVNGGKWVFNKAAGVKWARPKTDASQSEYYDEASGKDLIVDDTKGKRNFSGLKLTYTPKKGTFKGSFKVYALEGAGKTTKLKKYTVNVSGVVVDGVGYGTAICKKPVASWSVTVK